MHTVPSKARAKRAQKLHVIAIFIRLLESMVHYTVSVAVGTLCLQHPARMHPGDEVTDRGTEILCSICQLV